VPAHVLRSVLLQVNPSPRRGVIFWLVACLSLSACRLALPSPQAGASRKLNVKRLLRQDPGKHTQQKRTNYYNHQTLRKTKYDQNHWNKLIGQRL
jgi:hypothetical protein